VIVDDVASESQVRPLIARLSVAERRVDHRSAGDLKVAAAFETRWPGFHRRGTEIRCPAARMRYRASSNA
jgi:hypothetical protein